VSLRRATHVLAKDLRLGPRSPIFLWALALPLVFTFLISAVFGELFAPPARLAVADEGSSAITAALQAAEGIEVAVLDDEQALRSAVEAHDVDAGLLLPAGIDDALQAGRPATVQFFVSGESLASTRLVLGVTALEEVRTVTGQRPPVDVVVTTVGDEEWVPVEDRLLPLIVMYAVVIAGLFLPAASLVEERERRTLDALLVTPVEMSEVLLGKGMLGVLLATLMGWVTLALNRAFGTEPLAMTLFLVVGGVMMAEAGLVLGCWAKDANTLFTAIKGGGILVIAPVLFTLFPDLPQGVARVFPTYYFLQPIYEMAVTGTRVTEHLDELAVCLVLCLALLPAVRAMGRRLEQRSAATV
jgi:ABC-2 type transport system permease protein